MDDTSELPEERTRSRVGAESRRTRVDHDMALSDEPDSTDTDACPYPGLASFGLAEARWFFGRKPDTDAVIRQLGARLDGGVPLAVVAPSGAGKSSLLAAGLVPALADGALPGSQDWPVVVTTPGTHPLTTLADRIAELIGADPAAAAAATADPERFAAFMTSHGGRQRETGSSAQAVLIVDQFEEIFTECQKPERRAFIAALCTAARSTAVLVILGVRADFYHLCLEYPDLVPVLRNQVLLEPIRVDQLRSIITGPAEAEDFEVEPGLVELLLRDLGVADDPGSVAASYDPGALPLLAHTLRATWQRRSGRLLTVAGYRRTGGLRKAIATTAERVYTRLDPPEQEIAQPLLMRLVQVSEQTRALRRRVPRERLVQALLPAPAEETEKILETFGRARLLTLDTTSVEITHEALLWAWPRLAEWITADPAGLRIRQMLSDAAEAWEAEDRDPARLYRDRPLAIAQDWAASPGRKDKLTELEAVYLQASIEQAQREQQAERRSTRRLRTLVGVLAMALVVALLAGSVAIWLYLDKDRQTRLTTSAELAENSRSVVATHPETGMLLAVAAHRLAKKEPKTRSALLSAQSHYFAGLLTGHDSPINTVKFRPDGSMLATISDDGIVRLWDAADHHLITPLLDHRSDPVHDAEFSPDGLMLATVSRGGIVRLWNVARRQLSRTFPLSDVSGATVSAVTSITFSPDNRILATINDRDEAQLWDVEKERLIDKLSGSIKKVAFSKAGLVLATVGLDEFVSLWKVDKSKPAAFLGRNDKSGQLTGPPSQVLSLAFSPDGNTLATGSFDQLVRLWNVENPTQPLSLDSPLDGPNGSIGSVVFSPDGNTLLASSSDGAVWLWDVTTSRKIGKKIHTFTSGNQSFKSVAFNNDANAMATVGDDRVVRLWDMRGPILVGRVGNMQFSPDGRFFAAADKDSVQLWDVINRRQIGTLVGSARSMVFSENSSILATVETDGTVRLWDTANHRSFVEVPSQAPLSTNLVGNRHKNINKVVAFGPHGGILAIAENDNFENNKTVQLWDVTDLSRLKPLGQLPLPAESFIKTMTFSRGGRILVTAGWNGGRDGPAGIFAQLWDVGNPRQSTSFGKPLGKPLEFLEPSVGYVGQVAFSSDDRTLITVEARGIVRWWAVHTGQLQSAPKIFTFPGKSVRVIGLDFDGKTLATIDEGDTAIKLWDMDSVQRDMDSVQRRPSATLTGYNDDINAVTFSRNRWNNRLLATVSKDGIVRIWDLDPGSVTTRFCRIIGMTGEEQKKQLRSFVSSGFSDDLTCR